MSFKSNNDYKNIIEFKKLQNYSSIFIKEKKVYHTLVLTVSQTKRLRCKMR